MSAVANQLPLSNVVTVSVSEAGPGAGEYNPSNVAIFTEEVYVSSDIDDDGYKIYKDAIGVAEDFGTDSQTYLNAVAIFSQRPNILANNGYLVVIPFVTAVQHLALSGIPAAGSFTLTFSQGATAAINWDDNAAAMQVKIRAVAGLEGAVVTGTLASQAVNIALKGVYSAQTLATVGGSGLTTSAPASITITPTTTTIGEDINAAIVRTKNVVQYFGICGTVIYNQADTLEAAATIATLNKMIVFPQNDPATVEAGGVIDLLRTGSFTQSRGLFYGSVGGSDAMVFGAAYAGRGFSTVFRGSNTTQNMHLKTLVSVQPDPSMTQTLLDKCQTAGADVYVSLQGVPKIFASGANKFFDREYNLQWFVGALQVAVFNYLAQSSTKIPQTESGMDGLKGAARKICDLAVVNQYSAPGVWNSSTTFGDQALFLQNILQAGYYIYSQPIADQTQAAREAREAPLMQIALKEAGAIDKASIIVVVNA